MKPEYVSVIIPCRNEQETIRQAIESFLNQDYPQEYLEVLVVDGMSQDNTQEIVQDMERRYPEKVRLLGNPKRVTPAGLNVGIREAKGDLIIRADAHASYPSDYVRKSVSYLQEYEAANVGGIIKTVPRVNTAVAKAIALSLSHPLGVGNSRFRLGVDKPQFVDTVFGGCFRKDIFDRVGLFNEKLARSQDFELNARIGKAGGRILLAPDIQSTYYPKETLKGFFLHNVQDGIWAIYPLKVVGRFFSSRHYVPLAFLLTLALTFFSGLIWREMLLLFFLIVGIYGAVLFGASFIAAIKKKEWKFLFLLPLVFLARHLGYGIGSFLGIRKLFS